jgi:hypothetical protein
VRACLKAFGARRLLNSLNSPVAIEPVGSSRWTSTQPLRFGFDLEPSLVRDLQLMEQFVVGPGKCDPVEAQGPE